jgi:glycosyltransferase involved in cell wall biosynthesis
MFNGEEKLRILFLYTELAGYVLASLKKFTRNDVNNKLEIHMVKYPVNKVAPFVFDKVDNVYMHARNNFSDQELVEFATQLEPKAVICSGWTDRGYLQVVRKCKNSRTVLCFDNKWSGSLRQMLGGLWSRVSLLKWFTDVWVAGEPQAEFARQLGFLESQIKKGLYCCDYDYFHNAYIQKLCSKTYAFPKRFLYVGRYVENKGIVELWEAFIEVSQATRNNWELWCFGTGKLFNERIKHPNIKHHGFIQPTEFGNYIGETGVLVLPSWDEAWGVVVHEFATAGFPIVCSDKVGAASEFVKNGSNGIVFKARNKQALKKALEQIMEMDDKALNKMGEQSTVLAAKVSPSTWKAILNYFVGRQNKGVESIV